MVRAKTAQLLVFLTGVLPVNTSRKFYLPRDSGGLNGERAPLRNASCITPDHASVPCHYAVLSDTLFLYGRMEYKELPKRRSADCNTGYLCN